MVPRRIAAVHAVFLQDVHLFTCEEVESLIPSYEHECDEAIDNDEEAAKTESDRGESTSLRDHFDYTLKSLTSEDNYFIADDEGWEDQQKLVLHSGAHG